MLPHLYTFKRYRRLLPLSLQRVPSPPNCALHHHRLWTASKPSGNAYVSSSSDSPVRALSKLDMDYFLVRVDVSTSFKRLQAEKLAADKVLQELTSVHTVQDAPGLRDFLQNNQIKVEVRRTHGLVPLRF
jgi:hypothetical protein